MHGGSSRRIQGVSKLVENYRRSLDIESTLDAQENRAFQLAETRSMKIIRSDA